MVCTCGRLKKCINDAADLTSFLCSAKVLVQHMNFNQIQLRAVRKGGRKIKVVKKFITLFYDVNIKIVSPPSRQHIVLLYPI